MYVRAYGIREENDREEMMGNMVVVVIDIAETLVSQKTTIGDDPSCDSRREWYQNVGRRVRNVSVVMVDGVQLASRRKMTGKRVQCR